MTRDEAIACGTYTLGAILFLLACGWVATLFGAS